MERQAGRLRIFEVGIAPYGTAGIDIVTRIVRLLFIQVKESLPPCNRLTPKPALVQNSST